MMDRGTAFIVKTPLFGSSHLLCKLCGSHVEAGYREEHLVSLHPAISTEDTETPKEF